MSTKMILISSTLVLMVSTALAQTSKEAVVEQLVEEGFTRIEISRTLFGNTRIEGSGDGVEREIVLGKDGTIMRDRSERDDDNVGTNDDDDVASNGNSGERDNDGGAGEARESGGGESGGNEAGGGETGGENEGNNDSGSADAGDGDSAGDSNGDSDGESGGDSDGGSEGNGG